MLAPSAHLHVFAAALTTIVFKGVRGDQAGLLFSKAHGYNRIVEEGSEVMTVSITVKRRLRCLLVSINCNAVIMVVMVRVTYKNPIIVKFRSRSFRLTHCMNLYLFGHKCKWMCHAQELNA